MPGLADKRGQNRHGRPWSTRPTRLPLTGPPAARPVTPRHHARQVKSLWPQPSAAVSSRPSALRPIATGPDRFVLAPPSQGDSARPPKPRLSEQRPRRRLPLPRQPLAGPGLDRACRLSGPRIVGPSQDCACATGLATCWPVRDRPGRSQSPSPCLADEPWRVIALPHRPIPVSATLADTSRQATAPDSQSLVVHVPRHGASDHPDGSVRACPTLDPLRASPPTIQPACGPHHRTALRTDSPWLRDAGLSVPPLAIGPPIPRPLPPRVRPGDRPISPHPADFPRQAILVDPGRRWPHRLVASALTTAPPAWSADVLYPVDPRRCPPANVTCYARPHDTPGRHNPVRAFSG